MASDPRVLAGALALEVLLFAFTGTNFLSWANFFEIVRLSVELGLLALALTAVIITGGIDLSVGSMMGLGAVVFGILTHDHDVPVFAAALITL
ncbi:MAG: ABC transporter permease, partial [Acidobacteriota bacterium]|nr:ABC transporter permease [Acidobacteriota bacterium]